MSRQALVSHFEVQGLRERLEQAAAEAGRPPCCWRPCCQLSPEGDFWHRSCVLGRAEHSAEDGEAPVVWDDPDQCLAMSRVRASLWNVGQGGYRPQDYSTLTEFVQHYPGIWRVCLMMDKFILPPDDEASMHVCHRTGFCVWRDSVEPDDAPEVHVSCYTHLSEATDMLQNFYWHPLPLPRGAFLWRDEPSSSSLPSCSSYKACTCPSSSSCCPYSYSAGFFFFLDLQLYGSGVRWIRGRLVAHREISSMAVDGREVKYIRYRGVDVEASGPPRELFHAAGDGDDTMPLLDFCLYDSAGRLRLGRSGVELWSNEPVDGAPPSSEEFSAMFYASAEDFPALCKRGFNFLHFCFSDGAGPADLMVAATLPATFPHTGTGPAARGESPHPPGPRFPCMASALAPAERPKSWRTRLP